MTSSTEAFIQEMPYELRTQDLGSKTSPEGLPQPLIGPSVGKPEKALPSQALILKW